VDEDDIPRVAHAGADHHVKIGVPVPGIREDANGRAAAFLRAPADSLHHPAEAAAADGRAVAGDEAADGLRRRILLVGAVPSPDDCDLHGGG